MLQITKPDWATRLTFKHEDDQDGAVTGPVWWKAEGRQEAVFPSPYDARLAGWMTLRKARQMAKHFAVPFEEV